MKIIIDFMEQKIDYINFTSFAPVLVSNIQRSIDLVVDKKIVIPFEIEYNSGWKMDIVCKSCENQMSLEFDSETKSTNYTHLKELNSKNYSLKDLNFFSNRIPNTELFEVDGVYYLNRTDFNYVDEIQRKSAVRPILKSCEHCGCDYLIDLRIKSPMPSDRDDPFGSLGHLILSSITVNDKK